jgi:protein-tyrosine phosphatase
VDALKMGVAFIAKEIEGGGAVYVHCGSGIGRAATLATAYFVDSGLAPDEAWARIRTVRPFIRPTPPQLQQIQHYADQAGER